MRRVGLAELAVLVFAIFFSATNRSLGQCNGRWLYGPDQGITSSDPQINDAIEFDFDGPGPQPPRLVIAGTFTSISGLPGTYGVAFWDGARWQPLDQGLGGPGFCLTVYNGSLIVGGRFQTPGDAPAVNVARWSGSAWLPLGTGPMSIFDTSVNTLCVQNNDLVVGGRFAGVGGKGAVNIAKWNGSAWSALGAGLNANVFTATAYKGDLIVGGVFTASGSGSTGIPIRQLARWDGVAWSEFAGGVAGGSGLFGPETWLTGVRRHH